MSQRTNIKMPQGVPQVNARWGVQGTPWHKFKICITQSSNIAAHSAFWPFIWLGWSFVVP